MSKNTVWIALVIIMFVFLVGAKVGKETTESDMYHRDYKKCIENLPRNMDCVATEVLFKHVEVLNNERL